MKNMWGLYFSFALKAAAFCPEERGAKRSGNQLSRWLTSPPEAMLFQRFYFFIFTS